MVILSKPLVLNTAQPLICTWLQLCKAFETLHLNNPADVNRLHDIWLNAGVPAPDYTVAVPGGTFDERKPRPGDHFNHVVNPLAVAKWVQDVSARRGFPYNELQALKIVLGEESY